MYTWQFCVTKTIEWIYRYLTTDAYIEYEKVEGVKRSLCWAHRRRYFVESIPLDSNGKEIPGSKGAEGREFINLLFKIEEEMKDLSNEERKNKRQEASKAILIRTRGEVSNNYRGELINYLY